MLAVIEQFATEAGISLEEANYIFNAISCRIISKIPALEKVIADLFENTENDKLETDINEMISVLQEQQWKEKFKAWIIPPNKERISFSEGGCIF